MPPAPDPLPAGSLTGAVDRCRRDEAFLADLAEILRQADAATTSNTCRACGQCCHFEEFGHRLYVSTGELALLTAVEPPGPCRPGRCPYQVGSRCTARQRRSLGCRVFFCDEAGGETSAELYEKHHGQIRRLHARSRMDYHYVELTAALAQLFPPGPGQP